MKNNLTYCKQAEWKKEQEILRRSICLDNFDISKIKYVAGVDIAYTKIETQEYGCCSIVIIDNTSFNVVEKVGYNGKVDVGYYPGFLSFRELPLILQATKQLKLSPDVFVFDGNGLIHPVRMGIATHASFHLKKPCIGVAKTFFRAEENLVFDMPSNNVGSSTNIVSSNGEVLGIALRTKQDCKPVFVSVGNYMSLENAKNLIMRFITDESRVPMPTRLADIETHKLRKKFLQID